MGVRTQYRNNPAMDSPGFVVLADFVAQIAQEIRCCSTCSFIGERIAGMRNRARF